MHASGAAAAAENEDNNNKGDDDNDDSEKEKPDDEGEGNSLHDTAASTTSGGHLQERAAQFDGRTDKMQQDWYMKYAKLRASGSFLPRAQYAGPTSQLQQQQQHSSWGRKISPAAIRFLHWVGFDPTSALPPPSDDTTSALAFLGYDFFGRICEKAIEVRLKNSNRQPENDPTLSSSWLELSDGEQLTVEDIQRALEHPDVRPVLQFGGSQETGRQRHQPQLYFGPGFESRLELELDELVRGGPNDLNNDDNNKKPSPEEDEILRQEELLFAKLAAPPTFEPEELALLPQDGDRDLLEQVAVGDEGKEEDEKAETKKRGRPRKRLAA